MTKQLLDGLLGETPPSTVDVASIVRRERKLGLLRRAGAGVAVLGVAVLASGFLATGPGGGAAPSAPPAAIASTDPADSKFRLAAESREDAEATAARLSRELDRALRVAAPGATWQRQDLFGRPSPDGQPPNLFAPESGARADQMFFGGTGVVFEGRRGTLVVEVQSPRPCAADNAKCRQERATPGFEEWSRQAMMSCAGLSGCETRTGPNGERMVVQSTSSRTPRGGRPLTLHQVRVLLPDGRVLTLSSGNEFGTGAGEPAAAQDQPPLGVPHLSAMALAVAGKILP
jgi:hypothetical protein